MLTAPRSGLRLLNSTPTRDGARVPEAFLVQLRSREMSCPIRGINDPRLEYPELLIAGGWERIAGDDHIAYTYTAAVEGKGRWEQSYIRHGDSSRTLITTCGTTRYVIRRDPTGRTTSLQEEVGG